ncbi:MAG: glycosyltransferase [Anaerolineae bacterium]|nr:glycosyltransferase [Anaerolineae bacterium]NIN97434.1 glycosyltransferase [Anaerolineae bacterium]NIQ80366.1 glycosyltransferase [Anaerolineae bacterium]
MRIGINALFMIPGGVGGSETYLRNLIEHLGRIDHTNEYVVFTNREASNTFGLGPGNLREIPCPVRAKFRSARVLYEQLLLPPQAKKHDVEVLHSPGYTAPGLAPCASVVTIYDLNFLRHPEAFSRLSALSLRILVPMAARSSDMIITLSKSSMRDIVGALGVPKDKVRVIYPAASVPLSERGGSTMNHLRASYGIHGRFILTVAASHPHKNLCRLVEAYHILRREYSVDHQLALVGLKGRDHSRLMNLIAELSLEDDVVVTGWIPGEHRALIYEAADVFVFPSLFEGFGIPVLEAMMHGVPVVSSDAPSLCEAAGDATIVIDPHNVGEMAAAIHDALMDPGLRASLVERGYSQAKKFSWNETARQTLAVYEEAANRAAAGGSRWRSPT